jgi:hypothetical protein
MLLTRDAFQFMFEETASKPPLERIFEDLGARPDRARRRLLAATTIGYTRRGDPNRLVRRAIAALFHIAT